VAAGDPVSRFHIAKDATRDQPGDLHASDLGASSRDEPERVALVVVRRLVERGIDVLFIEKGARGNS